MPNHPLEDALAAFSPARRGVCPPRAELVGYFDRALGPAAAAALRAHLKACPFCTADLADLTALATPPLLEAVVQIAGDGLRLLSHSFSATAALQPVPVRGAAAQAVELGAHGESLDLQVRVHQAAAGSADVRVTVAPAAAELGRVRVSLFRAESLLESRLTQAGEELVFAAVSPGDYRLSLSPLAGDEAARVALKLEAAT